MVVVLLSSPLQHNHEHCCKTQIMKTRLAVLPWWKNQFTIKQHNYPVWYAYVCIIGIQEPLACVHNCTPTVGKKSQPFDHWPPSTYWYVSGNINVNFHFPSFCYAEMIKTLESLPRGIPGSGSLRSLHFKIRLIDVAFHTWLKICWQYNFQPMRSYVRRSLMMDLTRISLCNKGPREPFIQNS